MKLKRRKNVGLCALICACLGLSGCATTLTERSLSESPLAPIDVPYQAPQADAAAPRTVSAVLYFLSYDGSQLLSEVREVEVTDGERLEVVVLQALLDGPKSSVYKPIATDVALSETLTPVEVSGNVATVNLAAQARLLSPQELYVVRLAIAKTLIELPEIDYVNVLVEGREEGHDLAALMPMGTLSRLGTEDLSAQWAQLEAQRAAEGEQSITRQATLYFPVRSGSFVACEARTLTLSSANLQDYVLALLEALGRGAVTLGDARDVPAPNEYLSSLPEIALMDGTADKVVKLSFTLALTQAMAEAGLPSSLYWAMLVNTITTFVPGIDGVVIRVGDMLIESISAQETVEGRVVTFPSGVMRRADFAQYIADSCDLYFPALTGSNLIHVSRPVRQGYGDSPRAIMRELLNGPNEDESLLMGQAFPGIIDDSDVIALETQEDVLLINLSARFAQVCSQLERAQERRLIYAIVNTMTDISPITRVYFFIDGAQVSTLTGELEMKGAFLRNPGMIEQQD